jgi:hypothetical protein
MAERSAGESGEVNSNPTESPDAAMVEFRTSHIHGCGGFATRRIEPGTAIIEYVGERISKEESLRRCEQENHFIFAINEHEDLDGNVAGNPARFLNHSCSPNAEAQLCEGRVWIVAIREILPGEEIVFNYGYDMQDYREHPCHCGSTQCVGFIVAEEFFPQLRKDSAA